VIPSLMRLPRNQTHFIPANEAGQNKRHFSHGKPILSVHYSKVIRQKETYCHPMQFLGPAENAKMSFRSASAPL
jgi:hypothetical protein